MPAPGYTIEDGQVFYTHHYVGRQRLEGADPATFTPATDPIVAGTDKEDWHFAGKDHTSVWFMHVPIPVADAASFRYFHGGQCKWATDRAHIFCLYVDARPRVKVVKTKTPAGFRFADEPFGAYMRQYARDDRRVYFYGRLVRGADPRSFRPLPEDRFDEPPIPSEVYRDERAVFYVGREIVGVRPDDLVVFHAPSPMSRLYALDRDRAYRVDGGRFDPITPDELATRPQLQDVRDYLARRSDLSGYWFNRTEG